MKNALRIHVYLSISVLCFGLTLPLTASTIYNNTTNDLALRFNPGTSEIGNEIVLGGTDRYLTIFSFEYWGLSSNPNRFAGQIQARVEFYLNNGPLFNGYASPGTSFYDSGWFTVPVPTPRSTFDFSFNSVPLLLPASDFTWTVQFQGMGLGDSVGTDLYGPPTVGQTFGDFWQRIGTSWFLMNNSQSPPYANFAADMMAVPVARPTLGAMWTNHQILLYWPSYYTGYGLQARTNLAAGNWLAATDAVHVLYGSQTAFTISNSAQPRFFRLYSIFYSGASVGPGYVPLTTSPTQVTPGTSGQVPPGGRNYPTP